MLESVIRLLDGHFEVGEYSLAGILMTDILCGTLKTEKTVTPCTAVSHLKTVLYGV